MLNRSRMKPSTKKPRPKKGTVKREQGQKQTAADFLQRIEGMGRLSDGRNPLAVVLGRLGGLKGGRARADKLSQAERTASALKAARARWDRQD